MVTERRYPTTKPDKQLKRAFLLVIAYENNFSIVTDISVLTDSEGVFAGFSLETHGCDLLYFSSKERIDRILSMVLDDVVELQDIRVVALSDNEAIRDMQVNRLLLMQIKSDIFYINRDASDILENPISDKDELALDVWVNDIITRNEVLPELAP